MGCDDLSDSQRAWLAGEHDTDACVRCGAVRTDVTLARSSASSFKHWVCASMSGCKSRRRRASVQVEAVLHGDRDDEAGA